MTREEKRQEIEILCRQHGCSEKIAKIHKEQFIERQWHPHPSFEFEAWWKTHLDHRLHGIDAKRAFNCQNYRQEFLESRQFGTSDFQKVKDIMGK